MTDKTFVAYDMEIEDADHQWSAFSSALSQIKTEFSETDSSNIADSIFEYANQIEDDSDGNKASIHPKVQAFAFVLGDLIKQKWFFETTPNGLYLKRNRNLDDLVRVQLLAQRDTVLAEKPTQSFLKSMEQPGQTSTKKSIRHLIHDGPKLAKKLLNVRSKKCDVSEVIRPVIQLVTAGEKDKTTGHYLTDIWRYCRLTWSLPYQSVPGRQMSFIVRNDAEPGKPIMGIGSLASPVMQHNLRDNEIGWTFEGVREAYAIGDLSFNEVVSLMDTATNEAFADLYIGDFDLKDDAIKQPSFADIYRFETIYEKEKLKRLEILKSEDADNYRKKRIPEEMTEDEIIQYAEEPLFRGKRAARVAKLLKLKRFINKVQAAKSHYEASQLIFETAEGQSTLRFAVGEVRTVGAASRIADLSVCGAIPPYNNLIGGKLVALSVFSREIQKYYRDKYGDAESEITTFMAGRRIKRPTNLEIITTTSLFGDKLSQYHGLKIKKSRHPKLSSDCMWQRLGETRGEGVFQFGNETTAVLQRYMKTLKGYRQVNSVFGEGTSPKMRVLRTAISALGFNSDDILTHEQKRLFLIAQLNPNSKKRLLNRHLKNATKRSKFRDISDAWIEQWVKNRIKKDEVLEKIKEESFERVANSLRPQSYDEEYKLL